jgi:hypothetical protein
MPAAISAATPPTTTAPRPVVCSQPLVGTDRHSGVPARAGSMAVSMSIAAMRC